MKILDTTSSATMEHITAGVDIVAEDAKNKTTVMAKQYLLCATMKNI